MSSGAHTKESRIRGMLLALAVTCVAFILVLEGCSNSAFVVNGTSIGYGQFSKEVARRIEIIKEKNPKELEGKRGDRLKKETERQVATDLIRADLMEEQARKLGVTVPPGEVDRRIEEERAAKGYDRYMRELKSQRLSEEEYRKSIEANVLVEQLGNNITEDVTANADEAESFYLTHKDLFSHSLMVHVAHILLETEGQASMVAEEAKRENDFGRLAKSLSKDQATRDNGGDLGWIEQGTADPAIEQAAFSLAPGQVSGVVKASDGYHVLKVLERREAYTPPFSEVKDSAINMLLNRKKEEKFSDWLRTIYANADVRINVGIGSWDPRLGTVVEREER
jgi:foldase protein PrsA